MLGASARPPPTPAAVSPRPLRRQLARAGLALAAWAAFGLLMAQQTMLDARVRGVERAWWSVYAMAMIGACIWAAYTPLVVAAARRLRAARC